MTEEPDAETLRFGFLRFVQFVITPALWFGIVTGAAYLIATYSSDVWAAAFIIGNVSLPYLIYKIFSHNQDLARRVAGATQPAGRPAEEVQKSDILEDISVGALLFAQLIALIVIVAGAVVLVRFWLLKIGIL
jgi:hypothetical protein